jgi:hypothetical protein
MTMTERLQQLKHSNKLEEIPGIGWIDLLKNY